MKEGLLFFIFFFVFAFARTVLYCTMLSYSFLLEAQLTVRYGKVQDLLT